MFIFRIGGILAFAILAFGILRLSMGIYVAYGFEDRESWEWASRRYLGSKSSGEVIDQGIANIVIGLGLGMIAKIGKRVMAPRDRT